MGRREAMALVALTPLMPVSAEACTIQLPLLKSRFAKVLQAERVATVNAFFREVESASGSVDKDIDVKIASFVRKGFTMPEPSPYKLDSAISFGDLVFARAAAFQSTPDDECNPVTAVHAYYVCTFDAQISDQIATMSVITYG